jgi:Holliday junction resolvase RusA-like endonuclease
MIAPENIIEQVVSFVVPLVGPSVNHYKAPTKYIGRDGSLHLGFKLTKEAKAFKDAVAIFARGRTIAPATDAERRKVKYRVEADVYLGPKARGDADNFSKLILDSCQSCGLIHSDAFVSEHRIRVHKDDRANPRTEFLVERLESK